jgi:thiol-disulfide isomerase/thioredoxin
MKYDKLDVRRTGDVSKLMDLLKKNKIVVVLIYADWCGHCQTYKKEVWGPLSGMKNRKVPLAAINEAALKDTPFANAKIDGYPTVSVAGQDGQLAEFPGETGEPTNAMPNARDMEAMQTMVTTDPEVVMNNMGVSGPAAAAPAPAAATLAPPSLEEDEEPRSVQPTQAAEENLNTAGEEAVNTLANAPLPPANNNANASLSKAVSDPPDAEDDLVSKSDINPLDSLGFSVQPSGPRATSTGASQEGGSLYYALIQAAREVAPAAALAGAAVYLDKRGSRRRGRGARRGRGRTARKLRR